MNNWIFDTFGFKDIQCMSNGTFMGAGYLKLYKLFPSLMFTGRQLLVIARKYGKVYN